MMATGKKALHKSILSFIRGADSILITSHKDPDGDSIGSQLAMRRYILSLGKEVKVINDGVIPGKYTFLPDIEDILSPREVRTGGKYELAIILECSRPDRTGAVAELIGPDAKVINIDHHPDNSRYGDLDFVQDTASSVGEMLFEFMESVRFKIDTKTAIQLYTAILTDTGRFRYNSTTRRTMEIAGRLIELGVQPRQVCDQVYYSMPPSTLRLIGQVLSRMEFHEAGRICLMYLDREMLENSRAGWEEVDGLAEYSLYGQDTVIGAFLKEIDAGTTKVSLRSRANINVSSLARRYGGGGHVKASGFTMSLPMRDAGAQLLKDLREMIDDSV